MDMWPSQRPLTLCFLVLFSNLKQHLFVSPPSLSLMPLSVLAMLDFERVPGVRVQGAGCGDGHGASAGRLCLHLLLCGQRLPAPHAHTGDPRGQGCSIGLGSLAALPFHAGGDFFSAVLARFRASYDDTHPHWGSVRGGAGHTGMVFFHVSTLGMIFLHIYPNLGII